MRALKSVFVVTTSCTMVPNKKGTLTSFGKPPLILLTLPLLPIPRLIIMTLIITTSHRNREEYYFICYILAVVFQKNT